MFVYLEDIFFFGESVRHPFVQCHFVGFGIQDNGIGFQPVPSCPSGFLKVRFGRVGKVDMQYDTDIRLVDAHAESVGGYHDADFSVLPAFLPEVFYGIVQSGMIEVGGNAFLH